MAYLVELGDRAERDLVALYEYIHADESEMAHRWFNGLEAVITGLGEMPHRLAEAPESKVAKTTLRHLLYGKKPHIYRVIFRVDERRKVVTVLTIRHGARRSL